MAETLTVDICRTPEAGTQANTLVVCLWCECELSQLASSGKLKQGASGEPVKKLQEHLKRFGMQVELGEYKDGKPTEGADLKNGSWGASTTRAVRMFARHPAVGSEKEQILESNGKTVDATLAAKLRDWCRSKLQSPQNYWEMKGLVVKAGDKDALGSQKQPAEQTVLHDFVAQIERDLAKIGFAPHDDALCGLKRTPRPKGVFTQVKPDANKRREDKDLADLSYLVGKFQRQARWLWRMKADGTALPDVPEANPSSDPTYYAGPESGEVDALTARVLHEWASRELHMVLKKFELQTLHWPPASQMTLTDADSGRPAQLRQDAYEAWLKAATELEQLGGTLQGPYASSPRSWRGGKKTTDSAASSFSWHYSALAVDLSQPLRFGDATITDKAPYGLEKDGTRFRIWCWASPQPPVPEKAADDKVNPLKQYRNRNIKTKHKKGQTGEQRKADQDADPSPLYFATKDPDPTGKDVQDLAAKEGWYVDVTAVLEKHGLQRINRHKNWMTNPKAWEWWHYQYVPKRPPGASADPTFGEYLQMYGVHELLLREVGWSAHEDIDHGAG
ncbi:peptidoglycan-binding domain-containing protein [Archangium sp.]|uniref:peptidoglycan-binding domain-containing protein n=1 Tax=Archangium sp. TaxID=1872627 RepID=UPI002D710199|nr:peptidoglycan-binding domain-containing protein [Archangium sp.]HYO56493.1 peptidoglycan-binding domain-containing protein [Archangium sp.]